MKQQFLVLILGLSLMSAGTQVFAASSCPQNNDRHMGLHLTQSGLTHLLEQVKAYAQDILHLRGADAVRPVAMKFSSTSLVQIPVDPAMNAKTRETLNGLHEIGFFETLNLSKPFTLYLSIPQIKLNYDLLAKDSYLTILSKDSSSIHFSLTLTLKNLELKFPSMTFCKETSGSGIEKQCTGNTTLGVSNLGVRTSPLIHQQVVFQGLIDLHDNNRIKLSTGKFVVGGGDINVYPTDKNWDDVQDYSDGVNYNLFYSPSIKAPQPISISGDGMMGSFFYPFNQEGANRLIVQLLNQYFKTIMSQSLPPIEGLMNTFISDYLQSNNLRAKLALAIDKGQIEDMSEQLIAKQANLANNECLADVPGDEASIVMRYLAELISGAGFESKLGRVETGPNGGMSLFLDNSFHLITAIDPDQTIANNTFIPEYAPLAENACIADPQILDPAVQKFSHLPADTTYDAAISVSEKTINSLLGATTATGITQGLLNHFSKDNSLSMGIPKVRFKNLGLAPIEGRAYKGSIYIQTSLWIDFEKSAMDASKSIYKNFGFNWETWNGYTKFYGSEFERLFGGGKIALLPIEIRLDLSVDPITSQTYFYANSLYDQNGFLKNELGQYTNQEKMLSVVRSSVNKSFAPLEAMLSTNHKLQTDLLEQWLVGSFGASLQISSVQATSGGQALIFFNLLSFNPEKFMVCDPNDYEDGR